jgi:hypothetical protein
VWSVHTKTHLLNKGHFLLQTEVYTCVWLFTLLLYSLLNIYYWRHHKCPGRGCAQIVEVSQRAIDTGEAVIRRTVTVTVVKLFTPFIACLKTVCSPTGSNHFSWNLKVLDIIIGWIKIHICKKLFKCSTNCELFIFLEFMTSNFFRKTLERWKNCTILLRVPYLSNKLNSVLEILVQK